MNSVSYAKHIGPCPSLRYPLDQTNWAPQKRRAEAFKYGIVRIVEGHESLQVPCPVCRSLDISDECQGLSPRPPYSDDDYRRGRHEIGEVAGYTRV